MIIGEELREFWIQKHVEHDIGSLSGNGYITVFYLHLDDIFPKVKTILNIGVGTGGFEKACVQAGKIVDAVDIAPEAEQCISEVVRKFYSSVVLIPRDGYDLVTELLVAQHLTDAGLELHMRFAIDGLKKGGVYALQSPTYLSPVSSELEAQMRTLRFLQGGRVCRPRAWFEGMASKYGGRVHDVHRVWKFPEYNMIWNTYHIRKLA